MKILIDTSILTQHAAPYSGKWIDTGLVLWGGVWPIIPTGTTAADFRPNPIRNECLGDQARALGALSSSFRAGGLSAYTTDALMAEEISERKHGFRYGEFNLFTKISRDIVPTLPNLSFSFPGSNVLQQLRDEIERQEVERFVEIARNLPPRSSQDAWHIHCALSFDFDYFLTLDTKLLGQVRSMRDRSLREEILRKLVLPTRLCKETATKILTQSELDSLAMELNGGFPIIHPTDRGSS